MSDLIKGYNINNIKFWTIIFFAVLIFLSAVSSVMAGQGGGVAIIINKSNPIDDISLRTLEMILKQEQQYWKFGDRITLLMQKSGSPEKTLVLEKIYNMTDQQLKEFWIKKMVREDIPSFPKTLDSNEAVKLFVEKIPSAIGFIDSKYVDNTIKVLLIDGKKAGFSGYILNNE